jgi:mannose-6-phosphate isomerase-like protein (cupin superfamily)
MFQNIKIKKIMKKIDGKHCQPIDLILVNDHIIRMSYIDGEFHWHKYTEYDELFYLIKGSIIIKMKNQLDIKLFPNEMTVIPKGIEHCPKSTEPSYILLFEPFDLKTNGD